tara:strand:- start:95 stop:490 length:396 start_codon:yes stop_codon:yes gene_type:complete
MSKKGKLKLWIFVALFIGIMISISYVAVRVRGLKYFEEKGGLATGFGCAILIITWGYVFSMVLFFILSKENIYSSLNLIKKIGDFGDLLIFMIIVNLLLISYISIPKYTDKNIKNNEIEGEFDREEFQPLE